MTSRPRALRVSLALAGALAFAMVPAAVSVASASTPKCRVVDVRSAARHSRLQWAVNRARAGDTLLVYGTCQGTTTIPKNLTIVGMRSTHFGRPILDGRRAGSVVTVAGGVTVTIRSLTIANGRATVGGGILNHGTLTLIGATVRNNTATSRGGGIKNVSVVVNGTSFPATLTLIGTIVTNNTVTGSGGGIANQRRVPYHDPRLDHQPQHQHRWRRRHRHVGRAARHRGPHVDQLERGRGWRRHLGGPACFGDHRRHDLH